MQRNLHLTFLTFKIYGIDLQMVEGQRSGTEFYSLQFNVLKKLLPIL